MLAIGLYYRRRQTSTDEYFVGNRAMPPLLIGVSMFATLFSTISYLSTPGEIVKHGPAVLSGMLAIPIVYYIVGYLMVPVYMANRVTSAYELLEVKLGLGARLLGAGLFILLRLTWMALLIYFASDALVVVLLGPEADKALWLPYVTAVTGAIAVCYSALGGLRAVVVTDAIQFLLLFSGALLVLAFVSLRLGGFGWVPTQWNPHWDQQPLFSLSPAVRVTVFGSMLHGGLWWICTAGGDQTAVQRFMSTRDAAAARRSFLFNSIANAAVSVVLAFVGFALLGYFLSDSSRLPPGWTIAEDADQLFPHFLSDHLPIGLSGLVISGMFAAAMSSLDSGINSISAVVTTDFVDRFRSEPMPEKTHVRLSTFLALGVGLAVVGASSWMMYVPGNFLEISQRTQGIMVAPIFVLFFLALFRPGSTQVGAILGAAVSNVTGILVAYWAQLTIEIKEHLFWPDSLSWMVGQEISFQWILPVSLIVGIACGWLVGGVSRLVVSRKSANSRTVE
ncbi:MAG: sodium-coupled permease [Planctomycetota bacterium]|nr:MAG: sodium-coupled permease [Planctomycetota bacterium]REJ95351.1 MAG: sodium-coupled permease [Planctomycetota bacterium]REK24537.1 MAG: sodium-coupled permease [Planctomycetota bacterium]REK28850.1 MAG: sodium-coupled permease [Planctomycetota bacterium]